MRKAVAIPYVIALILGVIAIGILGFWFVSQGGKTVGEGSKAECQGKIFSYCLAWDAQGKKCIDNQPTTFDWGTCTKPAGFGINNCKAISICT